MKRALGLALVAMMLLTACGGSGGETVDLSMTPRVEGQTIVVEGTTDLPDGAMIAYEVTHDAFGTSDDLQDATWSLFADGSTSVSDGRYSVTVPVARWPAGRVTVWAAFQAVLATDQPAAVVDRYGLMGEHLTGSNVSESAGLKRVEIEKSVTLP